MNPICDVGGDYVFNEDGTHTYQPPCTQPVTHRFQPTDPTAGPQDTGATAAPSTCDGSPPTSNGTPKPSPKRTPDD